MHPVRSSARLDISVAMDHLRGVLLEQPISMDQRKYLMGKWGYAIAVRHFTLRWRHLAKLNPPGRADRHCDGYLAPASAARAAIA